MNKKNVFLAIPVYNNVKIDWAISTFQTIYTSQKTQIRLRVENKESLIPRARNVMLSHWYYDFPEFDYFMFLDADVSTINNTENDNMFDKLIEKIDQYHILSAPYNKKVPGYNPSFFTEEKIEYDTGVKELVWASTGCLMIDRKCIDDIVKLFPQIIYDADGNFAGKKALNLFQNGVYDFKMQNSDGTDSGQICKKYLSEDYSFSELARNAGYSSYLDTSIVLLHDGFALFTPKEVNDKKNNVKRIISDKPMMKLEDLKIVPLIDPDKVDKMLNKGG